MKRFTRSTLLAFIPAAPAPVLAQGDAPASGTARAAEGTAGLGCMNGAVGGATSRMATVMECATMMEVTHAGVGYGAPRNRTGSAP